MNIAPEDDRFILVLGSSVMITNSNISCSVIYTRVQSSNRTSSTKLMQKNRVVPKILRKDLETGTETELLMEVLAEHFFTIGTTQVLTQYSILQITTLKLQGSSTFFRNVLAISDKK